MIRVFQLAPALEVSLWLVINMPMLRQPAYDERLAGIVWLTVNGPPSL